MRSASFLFVAGAFAIAILLGWLAATLNAAGWAPLGLLPFVVGAILGVLIMRLAGALQNIGQWPLMIAVVGFAIVTVATEHAWLYRDFRRQWYETRAANAQVALFRPESPWSPIEYVAREFTPTHAMLWSADAVIIIVSAVIVPYIARRPIAN